MYVTIIFDFFRYFIEVSMAHFSKMILLECYMPINTSRKMFETKTFETIVQWFQLTADIIYSRRQPARIPIKQSDKYQQFDAERRMRTLKHKR